MIITEIFDNAKIINVYDDGVKTAYGRDSRQYGEILACWNKTVEGAHDMPAFGVSLNDCTVQEMKSGLWVEFDFAMVREHNGLPFERLLVSVKSEDYGFNLIRYNSEYGYDGRCFYFDLNGKNTSEFYGLLRNL